MTLSLQSVVDVLGGAVHRSRWWALSWYTADDAAVYQLNAEQALIATTDFSMPIVDDPFDFGRIAATNAISDVYAMGGTPINVLSLDTIDSVEPIYGLVALGLEHPKRVKRNADARMGDRLILGKPLGVGILSAALKKEALDAAGYARMLAELDIIAPPGFSAAAEIGKVCARQAQNPRMGLRVVGRLQS